VPCHHGRFEAGANYSSNEVIQSQETDATNRRIAVEGSEFRHFMQRALVKRGDRLSDFYRITFRLFSARSFVVSTPQCSK
jgi:hypothetical protein